MKISFSFDDGHVSDIRAANLLKKYGFTGTFYLPGSGVNGVIPMTQQEIAEHIVGKGHEVGGHTVTHPMDMKDLSDEKLKFELENNRFGLMKMFQQEVPRFCYPRGRHDERVRAAVKAAGYREARTTRVLQVFNDTGDPFQMPTTIHLFQRNEYEGLRWPFVAEQQFRIAKKENEMRNDIFYHVWGHTKELDAYNDWENFEALLKFISENVG